MVRLRRVRGPSEVRLSLDHRVLDYYRKSMAHWVADLLLARLHCRAIPHFPASAVSELGRYQALLEVQAHLAGFLLQWRALSLRVLH